MLVAESLLLLKIIDLFLVISAVCAYGCSAKSSINSYEYLLIKALSRHSGCNWEQITVLSFLGVSL